MELRELKRYRQRRDDFEIQVVAHAGSRHYQLLLEETDGTDHLLTRDGKPALFRTLDEIYRALRRFGIRRAYLVQQVAHDEAMGHAARYEAPLRSRMPLVF